MAYSFTEVGMTQETLLRGIDRMCDQVFPSQSRSGKVYLVDPRDQQLWDLKIALREAETEAGIQLYPNFTSDRYRSDLLKLGVSYVHFHRDAKRDLGAFGNDLSELLDRHDLYTPAGKKIENGARPMISSPQTSPPLRDEALELAYESGVRSRHFRIERRMGNARKVKEVLGLVCQGCDLDAEAAFGINNAMSCIDAHHLLPVADIPEGGRDVAIEDFAVLCATCHRLIHRLSAPDDLTGLRALLAKSRKN